MRICMLTFQYPPMFNGGVGTVSSRLARNLAIRGIEIHVVAPGTHRLHERLSPAFEDGVVVHRTFPALGTYFGDHTELGRIGDYVIGLHREMDFDLFHALFLVPAAHVGAVVASESSRPLVVSIHGSDIELMRYNPVLQGTVRWVLGQAETVTAVSSDLLDKAHRLADVKSGRVIANAYDPESFDSESIQEMAVNQGWRHQFFVESFQRAKRRGGPVFGTAGMIRPVKGFQFLLQAFQKLVASFSNSHMLVVGDFGVPEEKKAYLNQIKAMGLKRKISITGPVPPRHVMAWLQQMDIFAFPSLHEGSPNALMEAMACGLGVVASDVGGIPEIVTDGVDGILIPPGDGDRLHEELFCLAEDLGLREKIGGNARRTIETRFSPTQEAKVWIELYRAAIGVEDSLSVST